MSDYPYFYKNTIHHINDYTINHQSYKKPYDSEEINKTCQDINYYKIIERKKYVRHLNEWLNRDLTNDKSVDNEIYENDNDICNNEKIKDFCKSFFNKLLVNIQRKGFEIDDENQFKEDFIHYIYRLSKI